MTDPSNRREAREAAQRLKSQLRDIPILGDVVEALGDLFSDTDDQETVSIGRGDLKYAAVALAASGDNGDRYVARRFLEALGIPQSEWPEFHDDESVVPEPFQEVDRSEFLGALPPGDYAILRVPTGGVIAVPRVHVKSLNWIEFSPFAEKLMNPVPESPSEGEAEQEPDMELIFTLHSLDDDFATYGAREQGDMRVTRRNYDGPLRHSPRLHGKFYGSM